MSKKSNYHRLLKIRWTKNKKVNLIISALIIFALVVIGPFVYKSLQSEPVDNKTAIIQTTTRRQQDLSQLKYQGTQVIQINDGNPGFSREELSLEKGSWQQYGNLDSLNRVTMARAMLSRDLMPKIKRERLYVNPTGYRNKKVNMNGQVDWLYNRSHLIGYQLTGQNNNLKNLMTGTRSLNDPGMTQFENKIANYIRQTKHHVLYYVQPVFYENELVARGVWLRAQSIEDAQIRINSYIFNIQSGYEINYQDGTSRKVS